MAAPTLTQIMQGIATRLQTIQIGGQNMRVTAYVPEQVNPPCAYVGLPKIEYHKAFAHGIVRIDPVVTVLISKAIDRIGQPALSAFMDVSGSRSVHAAIEGDKTLGLAGCNCIVVDGQEGDLELGAIKWYAAVFNLHVVAAGA